MRSRLASLLFPLTGKNFDPWRGDFLCDGRAGGRGLESSPGDHDALGVFSVISPIPPLMGITGRANHFNRFPASLLPSNFIVCVLNAPKLIIISAFIRHASHLTNVYREAGGPANRQVREAVAPAGPGT